eukprot:scaffold256104_cov31-Tisochrysis_lutea.AAC.3
MPPVSPFRGSNPSLSVHATASQRFWATCSMVPAAIAFIFLPSLRYAAPGRAPESSFHPVFAHFFIRFWRAYYSLSAIIIAIFAALFTSVYARGSAWLACLMLSACAIGSRAVIQPSRPDSIEWAALRRPQLLFLVPVGLNFHFAEPPPASAQFTVEPVALAFAVIVYHLMLAMRNFMLLDRALTGVVLASVHVLTPIFALGWREPTLFIGANVIGFLIGTFFTSNQRKLKAMIDELELQRQADSRLYHVIKGNCSGAAMLISVARRLEEDRNLATCSGPNPAMRSLALLSDISDMAKEAAEWCARHPSILRLSVSHCRC